MAKVKIFYDQKGKTLTVWFDEPTKEYISEETGDEIVLIKNKQGKVIGFERLNFVLESKADGFSFEAVAG